MKKMSILFLQASLVLLGVAVLVFMIRFPMTEGRAQDLDLFSIYSDPLILYAYAASIIFFVGLFKAFKVLSYIRQNKLFSASSVRTLRGIKYCALLLGISIALAGVYIALFHQQNDDPAGFLGMCLLLIFISVAVASAMVLFETILQRVLDRNNGNDLPI